MKLKIMVQSQAVSFTKNKVGFPKHYIIQYLMFGFLQMHYTFEFTLKLLFENDVHTPTKMVLSKSFYWLIYCLFIKHTVNFQECSFYEVDLKSI